MGGTDTVFAPNLSRGGPPDLSGHSGGDDLLLQGAPTRYRLDLSSLIFHPVIKYDKCAETHENFTIPNSEAKHAAYLLKTLFKNAQSNIRIFTGHLFEDVYGDTALIEEACNFLSKDSNNSVRIAYQEAIDKDVIINSKFIQSIVNDEQKKGHIILWRANEKYSDFNNHFAVMDDKAFRFELDHANTKAIANFGDAANAEKLVTIFDRISKNSLLVLEK